MSVPSQHPLFTEEVRVALALNGGVSLAVWMAGCVVELDAARRGHLGPEQLDAGPQAARRSIYRERRRILSLEELVDSPKVLNAAVRAFDHASGVELPWIPVTVSGGAPAASGLRPAQRAVQLLLDAIRMSVAQAKERQDTQSRRALLALRAEVYERSVTPLVSPGAK